MTILYKPLLDSVQALRRYLSPQVVQRMSLPLVTKRLLDRLREHLLQLKQYSCQALPSQFTTFTPLPKPEERREVETDLQTCHYRLICILEHHSQLGFKATCDGVLAAAAFLGHRALVAVDAEDLVLVVGETRPCQRLRAGAAHETVVVPRLVLVVHSSRGYRLETEGGGNILIFM